LLPAPLSLSPPAAVQKKKKKDTYTKPNLFFRIESFIKDKKLIGYGGTAINHALPKESQFYHEDDIPDYDFFSTQPIEDIRELADILSKHFPNVEVKPAMFPGTYKLFVNYLPLVDMTKIEEDLFHDLFVESFQRDGIHYVPYNYLRMSMYQELARPMGDLTRWPKIFQRLTLLNKHHPFLIRKCDIRPTEKMPIRIVKSVNRLLKDYVCLGDYAMYYWQELFPDTFQYPQQDVLYILSETIDEIWKKLKGLDVTFTFYENKLIKLYEIYVENYPVLYVILSDSCINYNVYKKRKIATYDTTLYLYYALSFIRVKHLSKQKLLSYCYLLLQIKEEHPLMKRFHMPCYGNQTTFEELRRKREALYKKDKHSSLFFQYKPRHVTKKIDGSRRKRTTLKNGH
jgi:hypothetical protein